MVIKNYFYNLMYQILVIILPFITIPYISRVLGVTGIGQYALTNAYAQYFILFGMVGLSVYSTRQIAYVRDDKQELNNTFWELNILRFITMGISIVSYIVFIIFLSNERKLLFLIQGLLLICSFIDISWLFIALENFKKVVIRNTLIRISGLILIFIFVKESNDVWIYTLILGATQLMGQAVMWFELPKEISFDLPKVLNFKKHLKSSIGLFIPQIAMQVYTMLDKIMLGWFTTEAQVGLYDNSQKVIKILAVIVTLLATVTNPRMSNLFKNNKKEEFKDIVYKSFSLTSFVVFPMCFGMIAISNSFIPWFYGDEFIDIQHLFYFSPLLLITLGWSSIFGNQILIPMKKEKEFTISVSIGAVVNFLLNILFITKYKALGTTIASVFAEYTGMFLMAYFLRDLLEFKKLFRGTPKYLVASIIMYLVISFVGVRLTSSIINTVILVGIGIIIYVTIMIFTKDQNVLTIYKYMKSYIKSKGVVEV